MAVLTGFIAGSLNKIWPWKKVLEVARFDDKEIVINETSVLPWNFEGDSQLLFSVVLMLAGFGLIFLLESLAGNQPEESNATN